MPLECIHCGHGLYIELVDGTPVDKLDSKGGFREEYKCNGCGHAGWLDADYDTGAQRLTGCLASSFAEGDS